MAFQGFGRATAQMSPAELAEHQARLAAQAEEMRRAEQEAEAQRAWALSLPTTDPRSPRHHPGLYNPNAFVQRGIPDDAWGSFGDAFGINELNWLQGEHYALAAAIAAGAGMAGAGGAGAGAGEAVGSSGLAGGAGLGAGGGEAALGSGLTVGSTTGGIGGGALGSGLSAGVPSTAIGGGALGSGIGAGAGGAGAVGTAGGLGALGTGFFASETSAPVLGGQTAAATGGTGVAGGSGVGAGGGAAASGTSSALARIIRGEGTLEDYISLGGLAGATGLSIYGNNQIADKYDGLARDYMALGAPSRARYEASFDPNFDVNNIPGLRSAMDTSTQTILRQLSARDGNPFGNPGGLAEAMKYVTGNVALPALQNYRNQNAATGGYGAFSTAAPGAAGNSIQASGNIYSDLGRGLGQITNPPTSLEQILKQLKGVGSVASLA